jgi:hypothetical protein
MHRSTDVVTIEIVESGFLLIENSFADRSKVYAFENFEHLVQFLRNRVADILLEREERDTR